MYDVYDLFRRGTELLEAGHWHQAAVPLSKARDLAPEQTSIREALGRVYFHIQEYEQAAGEFQAVIDRAPANDYALFCLGRSLQLLGPPRRGPPPAGAGRMPAARPPRLPRLPGPRAGPGRGITAPPGVTPASARALARGELGRPRSTQPPLPPRPVGANLAKQLSSRALPGWQDLKVGARPLFL